MARFLRRPALGLILGLGLLHGLIYILLVPPWQHYDEPAHFEYAWLLAHRKGLPLRGEFDQPMRTEVAASMLKYNFFRGMDLLPDLEARNEAVWIGISQVDDPPLYYLIASLPARLFPAWDVTRLLYAMRFVSLALYLLSIWVAWEMMKELAPDGHVLRWMVPLSMVLLPGYTDLMTSVNNDVAAILLFCLFLWGCVRLIRQGETVLRLLWVVVAALLCLWTKETVLLALPLLGLVFLLALFRGRWRWVPWAALLAFTIIILGSSFSSWSDVLFWIRSHPTTKEKTTRTLSTQAPLGSYVIQIENLPNSWQEDIQQFLPADQTKLVRGKKVTLGAWIWATQPITIHPFAIYDGQQVFSQSFQISTTPAFYTMSVTLADDASRVRVVLSPGIQKSRDKWIVFYDGLVLVDGMYPLDKSPQFEDSSAQVGMWGGQRFNNLLRNASAEIAGPSSQPWVERLILRLYRNAPFLQSPSRIANTILDWRGAGWYYQEVVQNLSNTFWAKFGWGHVPLLPFTDQFYFLLQVLTLIGIVGAGIRLFRPGFSQSWDMFLFLGVAFAGILAQTILRGTQSLFGAVFIPGARYAYPVIIPFMLALSAGWLGIAHFLERWHLPHNVKFWSYALFFLILDMASLWSVFYYYYIR